MPALDKKVIDKIVKLRYKGWSTRRVASELGIGETTVRNYSPKDAVTIKITQEPADKSDDKFTKRQIEIAIKALEYIEEHGVIHPAYWHKDLKG